MPNNKNANTKRPKPKVDNTNATGSEKIYRTKKYTYIEKNNTITRVPGAMPVNDVSVVHGPPPQNKLVEVNKKTKKSGKVDLKTAIIPIIAVMFYVMSGTGALKISTNTGCYGSSESCHWLQYDPTAPIQCKSCEQTDYLDHMVIGSNGYSSKWNKLLYINSTTGLPNDDDMSVSKFAPFVEGTLLHYLYSEAKETSRLRAMNFNALGINAELERRITALENRLNKINDEIAFLVMDAVSNYMHKHPEVEFQYGVAAAEIPPLLQHHKIRHRRQEYDPAEPDDEQTLILRAPELAQIPMKKPVEVNRQDKAMKQPVVLQQTVPNNQTQLRDATPAQQPKIKEEPNNPSVLKVNLGQTKLDLKKEVVQWCSCTNNVMKLCNVEITFNKTRTPKPDESTYCLIDDDIAQGSITRKERLSCKQSEMRDGCSLSLLVGTVLSMENVSLVLIRNKTVTLDDKEYRYTSKLVRDICEYADQDRPYTMKPVSKYRPIFLACNSTVPDDIPARNNNRLHYVISSLAFIGTVLLEVVYQSWVSGLEIFAAGLVGFLVAVEDALISNNWNIRNYAVVAVLVACVATATTSKGVSGLVWFAMVGWLYTAEAIDGMTFEISGVRTASKITYETSLNMHAGDTIRMGNVSLTLVKIRQRREYDYAYTLPRVVTALTMCKNWDCVNNAPNCVNTCESTCEGLPYDRCTPMTMYNSCVWSALKCALCEGTGALFEKLCFRAPATCNLFDSPSNQGDREILLNYNIDGRQETHTVKVGQDAYATGGVFRITELEILSTNSIGSVVKCGKDTWCRKQKFPTKDFCGLYGMKVAQVVK